MFDIGGLELLLIAVVGLLVIGPERLPETLRTLGLWLGRLRRSFMSVKTEIEKEIGMDEVRRQLHNEAVMDEMKRIEREVHGTVDDVNKSLHDPLGTGLEENQIHPDFISHSDADAAPETESESNPEAVSIPESIPESTSEAAPEEKPRPRSEAELEAAHASAAKRAARQARASKSE